MGGRRSGWPTARTSPPPGKHRGPSAKKDANFAADMAVPSPREDGCDQSGGTYRSDQKEVAQPDGPEKTTGVPGDDERGVISTIIYFYLKVSVSATTIRGVGWEVVHHVSVVKQDSVSVRLDLEAGVQFKILPIPPQP